MSLEKTPDSRLLSALPYLSGRGTVADVGTDHAYLPIEIVKRGLAPRAVACDINRGPIESARKNIAQAGLSEKIDTLQTDGLRGVERFSPTDVLIFGMGGELIARILSDAPWIRDPGVRLILQPMTKAEVLREWLLENGFSICGETLSFEDQYYQTVCAVFGGEREAYAPEELYFGKHILAGDSPYLRDFLCRRVAVLTSVLEGKRRGRADTTLEEALLAALKLRLRERGWSYEY